MNDISFNAWDNTAYEADRADRIARGHDLDFRRQNANDHEAEWRESDAYRARPFRFEDLQGQDEPAAWGPLYPKTASAKVEKFRAMARLRALSPDEERDYGAAVGQWITGLNAPKKTPGTLPTSSNCASGQVGTFSAAKYRAQIAARVAADANRDRLAWAEGKMKGFAVGEFNLTIKQVYARAMADKRERRAAP